MMSQLKSVAFWLGAIILMVLVTIFYQPAAAKTGSLLVWTNERVYIMDIDTLDLIRVAPAAPDEPMSVSPGCERNIDSPCWVIVSNRLYRVSTDGSEAQPTESVLPQQGDYRWSGGPVSWSPDGVHVAYTLINPLNQTELVVFNAATGQTALSVENVDPVIAPAWSAGCAEGLTSASCQLGYKQLAQRIESEWPSLVGLSPVDGTEQQWTISPEPIFALRWTADGELLYSRPKRFFHRAGDHAPAYTLPPGAQLGAISPDGSQTVYYQPFRLKDCDGDCMYVGVWLATNSEEGEATTDPALIYNLPIDAQQGGLNFIPIWSPQGNEFAFFQDGNLVHYDLNQQEALIWYKGVSGKLRSEPIFSPNEEAAAFVDNQGQGYSEYRLVIVNPRLQPVEHIIQTDTGFRVLAWLPN